MLWSVFSWVLLVLGAMLLVRSWWWDRAGFRGRAKRRCGGCWYDLTGAEEGGKGWRCPECGRVHASVRSMGRVRRHKRLALLAAVMLVGAYAVSIRDRYANQQFQRLGWPVLVPTPVLIATIPLMPDGPGSVPDRNSGTSSIPIRQYPLVERFSHQIMVRLYEAEDTSRLDRWALRWLARRESWDVLTDESSVRGEVYTYVYRAWARQRRLGGDEERWARSVYWMDMESPDELPQMSPVYVRVNEFRRLLDEGHWRVQIGKTLFKTRRRSPDWKRRLEYVSGENAYRDGYVRIADFVRWPNMMSSLSFEDLPVRGRIYEGEPDVGLWWPVGVVEDSARVTIVRSQGDAGHGSFGAIDGVELVEDDETIAWIGSALAMNFVWERRFPVIGDLPIGIRVSVREGRHSESVPGFTFGGTTYIEYQQEGGDQSWMQLEVDPAWWALRDETDQRGERVLTGRHQAIGFSNQSVSMLNDGASYDEHNPIVAAWFVIMPSDNVVGGGNYAPMWDLDGERVYAQPIRIPLEEQDIAMLEGALKTMQERSGLP